MHPNVRISIFQISRDLLARVGLVEGILGVTKWDNQSAQLRIRIRLQAAILVSHAARPGW